MCERLIETSIWVFRVHPCVNIWSGIRPVAKRSQFFKKFDHFCWSDDETLLWEVLDVSCYKERPVFRQSQSVPR